MRILYVLPRNMYFGTSRATSIDLCCKDLIVDSIYRRSTQILTSVVDDPFEGFDLLHFPTAAGRSSSARTAYAVDLIRTTRPDIVVVQQHGPSARMIARKLPAVPVVLHRHAYPKRIAANSLFTGFRRLWQRRLYNTLAGIIHVSQACDAQFTADWPEVTIPRAVVPNGLRFSSWQPNKEREQEILCVGRAAPEKGILEAAQGVAGLLPRFPGWRARFILSDIEQHPDYVAEVRSALAPVDAQIMTEVQRPFSEVKRANMRAAIAIVPSLCREAFGRTALEAHAGGAALISSGRGGLHEVSGGYALLVDPVTPDALGKACETLISAPELRQCLAEGGRQHVLRHFTGCDVSGRADAFFRQVASAIPRTTIQTQPVVMIG